MKTISIVEFFYHAEVLRETILLFENQDVTIQIFTTSKILKNTGIEVEKIKNINLYIFDTPQNFNLFLTHHKEAIDNSDILIINTLAYNLKNFYKLKGQYKTILRIHNSNRWFQSLGQNYRPIFTPYMMWKDFSYSLRLGLWKQDFFYRKKIIDQCHYYAFADESLRQFALKKYKIAENKTMVLPFSSTNKTVETNTIEYLSDTVTFMILGKVDFRKRDYSTIYDAFKQINFQQQKVKNVRLILAGSANSNYGQQVVRLFQSIDQNHFEVLSFNQFLPQKTLEKLIQSTQYLIAPINVDTRFRIFTEKYGSTKMSGVFGDLLKYQIPTIVPSNLEIAEIWQNVMLPYEDTQDLQNLIVDILNSKIEEQSFSRLNNTFSRTNVAEKTMQTLMKVLDEENL